MERRPTMQDITWFLDLHRQGQLDLDPPYQRRSVWTPTDREYFLDTIFKNYPCPAIFLHKETDDVGKTTYHVVDGKQRLQTILMFKDNEVSIGKKFGDVNFVGKKFEDLSPDQKKRFWDYVIIVDFVNPNSGLINEVFDRLNRNARNLNEQELRHAKYDGWFINEVEKEAENGFWEIVKISTKTKSKRMKDIQFISELLMVIIEKKIIGFDQNHIDTIYAKYNDLSNPEVVFEEDSYISEKDRIRNYLNEVEKEKVITKWAITANNFYTLWSLVALLNVDELPAPKDLATKYNSFMEQVNEITEQTDPTKLDKNIVGTVYRYYENSRGASTDLKQRTERLNALKNGILQR
ncbi:DUF262 domain-containing protein [Candidatus Nitrosotenuis sp. DW1]|uniref:DUF262 domain-containing protein n=1 Tax=Candidatus Nitrosotenuis sp. DW1 TaxID=2259672 RepID=UPI0015CC9CBD|nr:DUF262 domain-containing protein [Candidatus Nitrosotenuis sp. DW1]QLH08564.1 hypothetical protein DSQ19_02910 [Candidatus Nitrosotenuis sp. DW1]